MTTEIGFGLVGAGMIGKVHAEAIQSVPGARLVAVPDDEDSVEEEYKEECKCKCRIDLDSHISFRSWKVAKQLQLDW